MPDSYFQNPPPSAISARRTGGGQGLERAPELGLSRGGGARGATAEERRKRDMGWVKISVVQWHPIFFWWLPPKSGLPQKGFPSFPGSLNN